MIGFPGFMLGLLPHTCVGQRRVRGGGTLHHMAPELVANYISKTAGRPITNFDGFACDVWALGVMLIQLLTGKLPFWPTDGFNYHSMQALLNKWVSSCCMMLAIVQPPWLLKYRCVLTQPRLMCHWFVCCC